MVAPSDQAKRALRAEIREQRRIVTSSERERRAHDLTAQLIHLTQALGAKSVATYLSTPDEPSTRGYIAWAHAAGLRILLPISRADGLLDWATYNGDEELDLLGMPMPTSEVLGPIAVNDVDLILVPAAAVDRRGMRMGWGRGYFDRTLGSMEQRPPVYAVIFDHELLDTVPSERHDETVDGVVTPSQIIRF